MRKFNISFAGAGRVGTALCKEFFGTGHTIEVIVSLDAEKGESLAASCNARWSSAPDFPGSTNVIIISVPDGKLKEVAARINCRADTLIAHTAGSYGTEVFPQRFSRTGILYPLQTFSQNRSIEFKGLPFLTEASDDNSLQILDDLASSLGGVIHHADAERRRMLHVAAVFACNFTNYMLTEGREIALKAGFSFDILIPLIRETVSKALDAGPENSQTGPAIRNDLNTVNKHLQLLSFSPELQKVYSDITESIIKYHKKK